MKIQVYDGNYVVTKANARQDSPVESEDAHNEKQCVVRVVYR